MSIIPQKRLEVFISSAQNPEKDFNWEKLRRNIKDKLATCRYINPFIIEDITNEIPSTQLFTYQVQKSDIIVLLLKGELRKGTAAEFAAAKKFKKPFLIYFIKEKELSIDILKLKREIEENDYCTYCGCLESSDNIEEKIFNDLIENVIYYYQFNHFISNEYCEENRSLTPTSADFDSTPASPNKAFLSYFKSCYNNIYDLLGLQGLKNKDIGVNSIFHNLGIKIIDWLIKGDNFYSAAELDELIEKSKGLYSNIDWLSKRWDALNLCFIGKFEEALKFEEEALDLARKSNMPEWIINDILIDCRNLENDVNHLQRRFVYGNHQQELDASSSFIYLPVSDRFLQYAYKGAIQEEIKINSQSDRTTTFGTNLAEIINNIENYLFSAILYGSYTHIVMSRQALAQVLYQYGKLYNNGNFIYLSLSLYLLSGDTKNFKQILIKEWDTVYSTITAHANDLWKLTDNINLNSKDSSKQVFLENLGTYLSDDVFLKAEIYLYEFSDNIHWGNAENYFDCLKNISPRLNHSKLITAILPIIEEKRFHLGIGLTKVLFNLDIRDTSDDILNLHHGLAIQ